MISAAAQSACHCAWYFALSAAKRRGSSVGSALRAVSSAPGAAVLATLDEIEGYSPDEPDTSSYRRVEVDVTFDDGRMAIACTYFYNAPLGRAVTGTLLVSVIAMLVALPMGLLSAIYLSEYADERLRRAVKPILEILAGVPTVVYGYFALLFVTPLLQRVVPGMSGANALSPGIVMGLMILPLVSSLSEDAMRGVPRGLREGSYALGATKMQTSLKVVVPAAFSGITAAFILAVSRAIGETMIVAIAAGQQPRLTLDPTVPIETMTAYIVQVSQGDTPQGTLEYRTIFAVGLSLFVTTLVLNVISFRLRQRILKGGML